VALRGIFLEHNFTNFADMPCGGGECVVEAGCIHGCCVGGRKGVRSLLCMEEVTRTVSTKSHRVGADWWTTDSSFVLTLFIFKAPNYVRVEFLLKTDSGYPVLARTLTESEPFFLWQTLLMALNSCELGVFRS